METKLLPAPSATPTSPTELVQQAGPPADALAQLRKGILGDCGIAPQQYLDEIVVAEGGE